MKITTASYLNWLFLALIAVLGYLFAPSQAAAAEPKVAGWIPYWAAEAGIESAIENIDKLDTIHPFVYEVTANGTLVNKVDFDDSEWEDLFEAAEENDVEISIIIDKYAENEDGFFEPYSEVYRGSNKDFFREIILKITSIHSMKLVSIFLTPVMLLVTLNYIRELLMQKLDLYKQLLTWTH